MLAAVEAARDHVHIETYIFADDEIGRRFAEVLERKRREGVAVRIVYDAIGSVASDREFFADLVAHGIEVAEFRPMLEQVSVVRNAQTKPQRVAREARG